MHIKKILSIIIMILFLVAEMFFLSCSSSSKHFDENAWKHTVTHTRREMLYADHYKDGEFFNPWLPMKDQGIWSVLNWKLSRGQSYTAYEKEFMPQYKELRVRDLLQHSDKDYIVWIGHNTFLIHIDNTFWIIDPIFSARALLPKRKLPPAISIDELLKVSHNINIIITHNHYDHLDTDSIEQFPAAIAVYVPLGLRGYIEDLDKRHVYEMDWWQSLKISSRIRLTCLPAQHWSNRVTQGKNTTLWASFMLETSRKAFYIGGDSGYFIGYKEFGKKFKRIDYAFLPVGAYHPRWFMHYTHMNIHEALQAFKELQAHYFIPTQWGTFQLGDAPPGFPIVELNRAINTRQLPKNKFLIMQIGDLHIID